MKALDPRDPQDPLPEGRWLYRRLFIWGVMLFCCGLLAFIVHRLEGDPSALKSVAQWTISLMALLSTYYLIAPSAEQLAKIVQAGRLFRAQPDLAPGRSEREHRRSYRAAPIPPRRVAAERDAGGRVRPDDPDGAA